MTYLKPDFILVWYFVSKGTLKVRLFNIILENLLMTRIICVLKRRLSYPLCFLYALAHKFPMRG